MLILRALGNFFDVKGSFLHEQFTNEKPIFVEVPQRWKKFYPNNVALELLATLCGLKQSAFAFFVEVMRIMKDMRFERSKSDPCLFY